MGARHREGACRDAGIACARAESLGVDSLGPWVEGRGRVVDPRPLGAHVGRVLILVQSSRASELATILESHPRPLNVHLVAPFFMDHGAKARTWFD